MKKSILIGMASLFAMALFSCNDDNEGKGQLTVRLTDAPSQYQEVLIDIQSIEIHSSDNENDGEWQTLEVLNPGVYNLLDFNNGLDTLLVDATLPTGNVSQMRMLLGSNNHVKIDGVYHDLSTPSAQQSGLKFNINANIQEGFNYKLWIDFDAARSIVEKGNGTYSLKPVIRTYTEATSGSIKGVVAPVASTPVVHAINAANDTVSTFANIETGEFRINGLNGGTYKVVLKPAAPFLEKTLENINVSTGVVTDLGTLQMEQPL